MDNNPCHGRGICKEVGGYSFECNCHSNLFQGSQCSDIVHHCTPSLCLNGGTCEEAQGTFICNCQPLFEGVKCEKAVDIEGRLRATGAYLVYNSEIYEATNETLIILLKELGTELRYEFSAGDGFKFSASEYSFSKRNAREFAQKNGMNTDSIPDEPRYVALFHHVYSKAGIYYINVNIYNHEVLVMETKLPTIAYHIPNKCVPQILAIQGCGSAADSRVTFFPAMRLSMQLRAVSGCVNTELEYSWTLYRRTFDLPFPQTDSYLYMIKSRVSHCTFESFGLPPWDFIFQSQVTEFDKKNMKRTHYNVATCWFHVVKRPPRGAIVGGNERTVDWKQAFVIDGSDSFDPDTPPDEMPYLDWTYQWTCWNSRTPEASESFCKGKNMMLTVNGPKVSVPARALAVNESYYFGLIVSVEERTSSLVELKIFVTEKKALELDLRCRRNCDSQVLPLISVIYEVICTSCEKQNDATYEWDMIPSPSNKKMSMDWEKDTEQGRNSPILIILANCLVPGDVYTFKVNVYSKVHGQEQSNAMTLEVSSNPKVGNCNISPEEGLSLSSFFTVLCTGFEDNTEASNAALLYEIFQKSPKEGEQEILTLLDYDTEPISDHLMLMPGDAMNEYLTTVVVKVSNHLGMHVWYNLSVKVYPITTAFDDIEDLEAFAVSLTSHSSESISGIISSGNIPGAVQYITSLTEILSGIDNDSIAQRTADLRSKLRGDLFQLLNLIPLNTPYSIKQVSSALYKIVSPWEGEKLNKSSVTGRDVLNISSEMAKDVGNLILGVSSAFAEEFSSKEDFFSRGDFKQIARNLIYAGENTALQNHSVNLYHFNDDWVEDIDESTPSSRFTKEKNEDYPNYKEIDMTFQDNLENFRLASMWYFEGIQEVSHSIASELFPEERAVELHGSDSVIYSKKVKASDLTGQKFGPPSSYSGLKISREYAEMLQNGPADVFVLEVAVITYNPIWWLQATPSSPSINSEVVHANFKNLDTREEWNPEDTVSNSLESIEIYLALNSQDKRLVEANRSMPVSTDDEDCDGDDIPVHQIQAPDGASLILTFEPPLFAEDKYQVVILKNHRPCREDFSGDVVLDLPYKDLELDINGSFSIFVRGAFSDKDPGFPQFFYLSVMPHPNNKPTNEFSYKFYVSNILCNHYMGDVGKWSSNGCEVGSETTFEKVHCTCSHLSLFGASFFVAPNRVDPFSDVKLFLKFVDNPVSVALVCTILILYAFLMILARRKDLKDKKQRAVIFLEDNVPGDAHTYLITVHTGWRRGCGSTANVSLRLQGTEGISRIHTLSAHERKILQPGGEDWFLLLCPHSLGELLNIGLWHDNSGGSPSWYCRRITVRELKEMQVKGVWIFLVNRWLTVAGTPQPDSFIGTMPCCKITAATTEELSKWKDNFTETATTSISDKHLWISIFSRPPQSTFTSCQRLSIAANLLMSTLLVTIMFYGVAKARPGNQLDVGGFRISIREWLVALQSIVITTLLNIPIAYLFRNSDPRDFKLCKLCSRQNDQHVEREHQYKKMKKIIGSYVKKPEEEIIASENNASSSSVNRIKGSFTSCWDDGLRLPHWCRLIGWVLCLSSMLISAYFICLYGLSYGRIKSLLWLSAVLLAVFKKALLVQPIKILILAVLQSYAKTITGPDEESLKKNPLSGENVIESTEGNLSHSKPKPMKSALDERLVNGQEATNLPLKRNQPLMREEIKMFVLTERRWQESFSHAFDVLALVLYVVALHIVTYGAGDPLAWNNANVFEKILVHGLHNQEEFGTELTSIVRQYDLFDYLNNTAAPALHASKDYCGLPLLKDEGWTSHLPSKLLGAPRLRQIRVFPELCNMSLQLGKWAENITCLATSSEGLVDQCSYGPGWSSPSHLTNPNERIEVLWRCYDHDEVDAPSIVGKLDTYTGNGYSSVLGRNLQNSRRIIKYMMDTGWIDRYTQALVLEFSVYSVDCNLFTIGHVLIERSLLGNFVTSYQILTTRLLVIHFGSKKWETSTYFIFIFASLLLLWRQCRRFYLSRIHHSSDDSSAVVHADPDVKAVSKWKKIFVVLFLPLPKGASMWRQIKEAIEPIRTETVSSPEEGEGDLKGLLSKKKSPPTVNPELLSSSPVYPLYPLSPPSFVEWLLIVMSLFILIFYIMRSHAVHEPLQRLDRGAASNERHKFVSLQLGINWDYAYRYALALDVCIATSALWKTLPAFRRLPEKTLVHTGKGPMPTMIVCFGIVLLAFAISGHTSSLLGSSTNDFSTVQQSLATLLGWALGVEASEEALGVGLFGSLLYCTFGIGCAIYIINLFLTLILEEFENTHKELKNSLTDVRAFGILEFGKEFWRRKEPVFKQCKRKIKGIGIRVRSLRRRQKKDAGEMSKADEVENGKKSAVNNARNKETSSEGEKIRNGSSESSEEDDLVVSGRNSALFSLWDYMRLRAGGHILKRSEGECWGENVNPIVRGNDSLFQNLQHNARIRLNANGNNPQFQEIAAKLTFLQNKNLGKKQKWLEEELRDRMEAMTASTLVFLQKRI